MTAMDIDQPMRIEELEMFVEQFQSTRFYIHEMKDDFKRKASGDVTAVGPDLTISIDPSNPYSAETDVRYFKELFSKLKFNYLEQESKEKFLKGILDDPPLVIDSQDNHDLELHNQEQKKTLKATKAELENDKKQISTIAKDLCEQHDKLASNMDSLSTMIAEIQQMESELDMIRSTDDTQGRLTIEDAQRILDQQRADMQAYSERIEDRRTAIAQMKSEYEEGQAELVNLRTEKTAEENFAAEALRESQNRDPRVEELFRWYTSSTRVLSSLVDV